MAAAPPHDDAVPADTCPACGATSPPKPVLTAPDRLHRVAGIYDVAVCHACGSGRTLPPASSAELGAFYPSDYYAHEAEVGLVARARRRLQPLRFRHVVSHAPFDAIASAAPGPLLDVGCGRGDFGAWLVRNGWVVAGVDPSERACAVARSRGIEAQAGTLATTRFEQGSFAAVVMSHSLEHVVAPRDDLARVYELLRPGGVVAIALPNFASWQRRRFRDRWFALDLPRHRVHFVPAALERALTEAGFTAVAIGSSGGAGIMLASWQYRRFGRLVFAEGAKFLIGYALALALTPVAAVLDRIDGEGPILYAVAYRATRAD